MKKDKSFYYFLLMSIYTVTLIVAYFVSARITSFWIFTATAGVIVYPLTYFIQILFYERYGKNSTILMILYSLISLMFTGVLVTLSSLLPAAYTDGLDLIFGIDFRLLFGCLTGFAVGQFLNLFLYDYLGKKKSQSFAVAASISITIDSLLFVFLSFAGTLYLKDTLALFVGQYVFSIIMILFYTFCYSCLIKSINDLELEEAKELELISSAIEKKEEKKQTKKPVKKAVKKSAKSPVKKETEKKTTKKATK